MDRLFSFDIGSHFGQCLAEMQTSFNLHKHLLLIRLVEIQSRLNKALSYTPIYLNFFLKAIYLNSFLFRGLLS